MAKPAPTAPKGRISPPPARGKRISAGRIFTWISGIVSFSLVLYLFGAVVHQFVFPPPAQRLIIVQDVRLPNGLGKNAQDAASLAPGIEDTLTDGFDFQTYDAATHRLFIAHTGPDPDIMKQQHIPFDPQYDGNVTVFDTAQDKVVARIPAPQVAGVIDAPDLGKVFAADAEDNIIFDINVNTMQIQGQIQLPDNEGPDAVAYDPDDHRIFVSDPGTPADPLESMNTDPKNQDVAVIDAVNDTLIGLVNVGLLPLLPGEKAPVTGDNLPAWGRDVGHNDYDQGHEYVALQVAANADDPNAYILPPHATAEFASINAVTLKVDKIIRLSPNCSTPHGMTIDREQHVAFVACTDFDPQSGLFEYLLRVDLTTMTVIPTDPKTTSLAGTRPDVVRIDHTLHVLFVSGASGVTIFDEKAGEFHRLGEAVIGGETHNIAINEETQQMYFAIFAGGLPVVRICRYNPHGQ
ncbi:MAG TPA: hypothetical protein VJR48_02800 [Ktedonobacterales bacterium]|nr:hypothetical protein [Ktedonobacterales bacterium]